MAEVYDGYVERVGNLVRRGCQIQRASGRPGGGLFVSSEDFLDVVHEVFMKAFSPSARQGYDESRDYGPYLLMIARNTMIDWLRHRGATTVFPAGWFEDLPSLEPTPDEAPPWWAPETMAILEHYLAGLPRELRELHRHRYERGLSQEATAQAMGISRQNLRTLEERLRRGLAQVMIEPGESPRASRSA
jgi:RNA polymerase sigma factor (sigma-70 family)